MEELFLKLQRNKVTMTVRPVKGPYQHCQVAGFKTKKIPERMFDAG